MPTDRHVSPLRAVAAMAGAALLMLLVAALGEWVIIPSSWVRSIDEGGVAHGTALLADRPGLTDAAVTWAALSGPWVVHPVVAVLAGVLALRRRITWRAAAITVLIGLAAWALGSACKEVVDRPRPDGRLVDVMSWSYPSGHATNIAVGAVLVIALVQMVNTAWIRWGATLLALVAVALTAADRIVLGVHYVSDVTMGLALGTGVALIGLAAFPLRSDPAFP